MISGAENFWWPITIMFPSGRRTLSSCQWHRDEDLGYDDDDHHHDYNILTLPEMRGLPDLRHSPHSHSNIAPAVEVYNFQYLLR